MESSNLTIEQLEMIRRLRNSGASLLKITEAYQEFDRLDHEFGSFGHVKISQPAHQITNVTAGQSTIQPHFNVHQSCVSSVVSDHQNTGRKGNAPSQPPNYSYISSQSQSPMNVKNQIHNHSEVLQSRDGLLNQSPSFLCVLKEVASNAKSLWSKRGDERTVEVNGNSPVFLNDGLSIDKQHNHGQHIPMPCPDNVVNHNFNDTVSEPSQSVTASSSFSKMNQDLSLPNFDKIGKSRQIFIKSYQKSQDHLSRGFQDNTEEIDAFKTSMGASVTENALREAGRCILLSAGSDQIVSLLRKCSMTMPAFDPSQLCSLYGLSKAEVDAFCSGHIQRDGDNGLQIVDWFISLLMKTEWFVNEVLLYSQQIMMPKHVEEPVMDFTPRRERFTFRDMHLEVLESHFMKDRYPSQKERETIANECNIKMAMASDTELKEKERVTHINVDHWFRNKRKEMFRRAKLEKINSHTDSRLKPSTLMLDSLPSESSSNWQGYHTIPPSLQFYGTLTSNAAIEIDNALTSPPPNKVNQTSPVLTDDRRFLVSTFNKPDFDPSCDKETQRLEGTGKVNRNALSNNGTLVEIKTEPVAEEGNIEQPT